METDFSHWEFRSMHGGELAIKPQLENNCIWVFVEDTKCWVSRVMGLESWPGPRFLDFRTSKTLISSRDCGETDCGGRVQN